MANSDGQQHLLHDPARDNASSPTIRFAAASSTSAAAAALAHPQKHQHNDEPDHQNLDAMPYFRQELIAHVFSSSIFKKKVGWRRKTNHFLHSPLVQTVIVVFVILDALVVFAQLYVDLQTEKEKLAQLNLACKLNKTEEAEHMEHTIKIYEVAFEALHYTSMFLLTLFFLEVTTKMITGWRHFTSSIIEVLDGCIVGISFGLDIMLLIEQVSVAIESIAQLLILLRLWRIARIVNGAAVAMDSKWRVKYNALQSKMKALEKELRPGTVTKKSSSDSSSSDEQKHQNRSINGHNPQS